RSLRARNVMKELFEAVRAGDLARVQTLVDADPTLAIFAASILGETERLEPLLAGNRALVTAVSSDGWTPLHLAAFFGKVDAVRFLLNKGASVTTRSTNDLRNTPLHAAAAGGHSQIVKILLDHGADANARQHSGWAPLHAAAQNGDVESARALVAAGAEVSARADNNQRPLDLALTKARQSMVDFLESNGATL
ncbi:MAG: ankyrin repeat domain-containing protein, partial [Bryobacteraceae bacterium]